MDRGYNAPFLLLFKGVDNVWFRNMTTNIEWEITDKELIKRLKNDSNYEVVKKISDTEEPIDTKEVSYDDMPFNDLKKLASDKGINTHKLKKVEIINALLELEG